MTGDKSASMPIDQAIEHYAGKMSDAQKVELLREAAAKIQDTLSYARNEGQSAAVKEANANLAFHLAKQALSSTL